MKSFLLAATAAALIACVGAADAATTKARPGPKPKPYPAPMLHDGIPVLGTMVAASGAFWAAPSLDRSGRYVGYLVCSPFEIIGARCRER